MAKSDELAERETMKPEIVQDYSTFGLPAVSDPFAKLRQRMEIANVETWDFETEGPLMGLILAKADRFHSEFGRYPYLTVQIPDGSIRGVACVGMLLSDAADRASIGDLIGIEPGEKKRNRADTFDYNNHTVAVIPAGEHPVGVQPEKPF